MDGIRVRKGPYIESFGIVSSWNKEQFIDQLEQSTCLVEREAGFVQRQ